MSSRDVRRDAISETPRQARDWVGTARRGEPSAPRCRPVRRILRTRDACRRLDATTLTRGPLLSGRLGVPTDGPRHARARSSSRWFPPRPQCDTDSLRCSALLASPSPSRGAEQTPRWRAAPCSSARAWRSSCSTSCFAMGSPARSSATPKRPPVNTSTTTATGQTRHRRRRAKHHRRWRAGRWIWMRRSHRSRARHSLPRSGRTATSAREPKRSHCPKRSHWH
jgi:hypothetical protein